MTTATQPQLRYPVLSDQTRTRWQTVLQSRRPISDRARKLLTIALDAVESPGPAGLQVRWHNQLLWIRCDQDRLAELLQCSVRTISREVSELSAGDVLRVVRSTQDSPTGPREIVAYAVSLTRLEAVPEPDPTPELDSVICSCPDPFADPASRESESADPLPESPAAPAPSLLPRYSGGEGGRRPDEGATALTRPSEVGSAVADPVACALASGLAYPLASGLASLMNHDHEGLIEFNTNSSITHDHESEPSPSLLPRYSGGEGGRRPDEGADAPQPSSRRFDAIAESDVLAIAGFAITVDGQPRSVSLLSRHRAVREYFTDAVAAGLADDTEFRDFAALFRCAARRARLPAGDRSRCGDVSRWIRTVWKNRQSRPLTCLTPDDRAVARQLDVQPQLVPA